MRRILYHYLSNSPYRPLSLLTLLEINLVRLRQFLQRHGVIGRYEYYEARDFIVSAPSPSEELVDAVEIVEQETVRFIRKDRLTGQWQGFMRYHVPSGTPPSEITFMAVAMGYDWLPLPEPIQRAYNMQQLAA